VRHTPIPKRLLTSPQSNSGVAISQECKHGATRVALMPQGHMHYGREICAICGRFLKWVSKPETVVRQKLCAFKLAKLAMHPGLSKWERNFVSDVSNYRRLSPRQEEVVEKLVEQYLEAQT
jgi:hypothetical protein